MADTLYQTTHTNNGNRYALASNIPTPSNIPTHIRVLPTQAPDRPAPTFNKWSPLIKVNTQALRVLQSGKLCHGRQMLATRIDRPLFSYTPSPSDMPLQL